MATSGSLRSVAIAGGAFGTEIGEGAGLAGTGEGGGTLTGVALVSWVGMAGTGPAAPADPRETCVDCMVAVSTVASNGVAAPQAGQKRLFGVRGVRQVGQERDMSGPWHNPYQFLKNFQHPFNQCFLNFDSLLARDLPLSAHDDSKPLPSP